MMQNPRSQAIYNKSNIDSLRNLQLGKDQMFISLQNRRSHAKAVTLRHWHQCFPIVANILYELVISMRPKKRPSKREELII